MRTSIIAMMLVAFWASTSHAEEIEWLNDEQLITFFESNPNVCEDFRSTGTCDHIKSYKYVGNKRVLSVGRSLIEGDLEFIVSFVDLIDQESFCVEKAFVVNQDEIIDWFGENGIGDEIGDETEVLEASIETDESCFRLQALPKADPLGNLYIKYEYKNGKEVGSSSVKLLDDLDSVNLRIDVDFGFKKDPFREDSWGEKQ